MSALSGRTARPKSLTHSSGFSCRSVGNRGRPHSLPPEMTRIQSMTSTPLRLGTLALLSAAFLPLASAQTPDSAHTDAKGRHLAPRGTLYLLSYVAVKTDTGVEGFDPGQEVHVVNADRAKQTLVVSDGHAQVEVPPSKLTNDMDLAAMVRRKDEANQAQVAAYIQAEQVAYNKYEREAADATAKDLEHTRETQQAQAAAARREEQPPAAQTSQPVYASANQGSYYGDGGYGFGSPYSFFVNGPVTTTNQAPAAAPAAHASNPAAISSNSGAAAPAAPAAVGSAGKGR